MAEMNNTNMSCPEAVVTQTARNALIGSHAVMMLIGLIGNVTVIYIIGIKHKLVKCFDIQIVSLAVSDLISAIFVPVVSIHDMVLNLQGWLLLGDFGCKVFVSLDHVTTLVSASMLILISVDRLRAIRHLNKISDNTRKMVRFEILAVWLFAFITVSPYMHTLSVRNGICHSWKWSAEQLFLYYGFYINLACFLPAFILTNVYAKSIYLLAHNEHQTINERRKKQFKRITAMFTCIIVLFFLLTIPYMIVHFISSYYGTYDIKRYCNNSQLLTSLTYGFYTVAHMNYCINPFVYVTMHPRIKKSLNKFWKSNFSSRSRGFSTGIQLFKKKSAANDQEYDVTVALNKDSNDRPLL